MTAGLVRSVLGDVEAADLGEVLIHEHLRTSPPSYAMHEDPDLAFGTVNGAASELAEFAGAGGGAMVEMTTIDYGRDAGLAVEASRRSGVVVLQATGMQKGIYYPAGTDARSMEDLCESFASEVIDGIDGSDVHAGVIKAGSCSTHEIWPVERTVIRAVGRAALRTGAPVITHTQGGFLGLEQVDLLEGEGLDPERVCIGHLDRNLDWGYLSSLARRGVYLGFDQWTKSKYAADVDRAALISRLVDAGHTRIMVAGDLGRGSYQPAYGGAPGFAGVIRAIRSHLGDELSRLVLVSNPAAFLPLERERT